MATQTVGQAINDLRLGVFKTLCKVKPTGALQVRKQQSGAVAFYWRYSIGISSERVSIGHYDPAAAPKSLTPTRVGYSVPAAVRAAESLAMEHHQNLGDGGRPALIASRRAAQQAAAEAMRQTAACTLENLLIAYCDHLERIGRRSHKDARSIFKLHVIDAWPEVATSPAKTATGEQFADMMRKLIDDGKGRTANKLRSYARAAYQTAKSAKSKPSVPVSFKAFEITHNPVADTEPDESQNRPDKRPLSADELRTYWSIVKRLPGFRGALLRLHLLTGGQRIEQLVNLLTDDIAANHILLYDGKGRPGRSPRPHTVPLTTQGRSALRACKPTGKFALSTDDGNSHVAATTLSDWAAIAAAGVIEGFQAKRIRSGVETLLAGAGVSQEIRGRLQSHGISGVQARHYDGHDYLVEKRNALVTLRGVLEQRPSSNVRSIKATRRPERKASLLTTSVKRARALG